jgi:hypothetical protein
MAILLQVVQFISIATLHKLCYILLYEVFVSHDTSVLVVLNVTSAIKVCMAFMESLHSIFKLKFKLSLS